MRSVWENDGNNIRFDTLEGDKNTEVLIIGGGIAGVLCAYKLKSAGVDCILTEAGRILGGITKNTTAKITLTHGLIYGKLINRFGEENARLYLEAQKNAMKEYESLCRDIDCDYEKKDSFVYSIADKRKVEREVSALNTLGEKAEFADKLDIPIRVAGAVRVKNQAQFHPMKFLYSIAEELPIFENTKIVELMPGKARANNGRISYKKLVIATHFPMLNKHGSYFLKLYQHRSYVIALRNAEIPSGMYVDEADTGLSFRGYKDMLLLGGGGHRTGKQGGCWKELESFAMKHYKGAETVAKWATQDCMTLDSVPYIGQYSKSTPDVFVLTGFNKWGMTNAMIGADIICDLVQSRETPFAKVFSPSRSILRPQLCVNAIESTIGLLTPTAPRCPHLGCALKYNKAEHTWDCPCHGSRFTEDGELIDNPATDDKKFDG